jgi:toxin HigB-1
MYDNMEIVIRGFGNRLAEDLFHDRQSKRVRVFPPDVRRVARRKLLYLHDAATLNDLRVPPANRLERLKGSRAGHYSIRINDQWRLVFKWLDGDADDVAILDYHS